MKKNNLFTLIVCLGTVFMLAACGGPKTGRVDGDGSVRYDDSQAVETVNTEWGSTDLQNTAESMTQSMLSSPYFSRTEARPKIRLRAVVNKTDEHIDTKSITDKIRVQMLRSGKVRFLADTANLDQVFDERDFSEQTTRRAENKLLMDADYIVTGSVRSIRKGTVKKEDIFYQITLELVDPQSGEIVWADEKEIRKVKTRSSIGW